MQLTFFKSIGSAKSKGQNHTFIQFALQNSWGYTT